MRRLDIHLLFSIDHDVGSLFKFKGVVPITQLARQTSTNTQAVRNLGHILCDNHI